MGKDIFSVLGIDPNLGINEDIVAARPTAVKATQRRGYDLMRPGEQKKAAAHELLGDALWNVLTQIGDSGVESLDIQYIVEKTSFTPGSSDLSSLEFDYDPPRKNQKTYVLDEGEAAKTAMVSQLEAMESLRLYAGHSNSRVTLGHANEAHHLSLLRCGPNLRQVLLRMWLLHLDVLAGAEVRVRVDSAHVRQLLPNHLALEEECEYAKSVPGVRVHVNSLDDTARALLSYACGLSPGDGASVRITRYVWEPIDLTFYGGILPVSREVDLLDPAATARSIVAFAEKYGAVPECGETLRMALHMYGTISPANKLSLRLGAVRLHQQTHQKQMVRANYRCHELAGKEMVSLAMLVGEAVDSGLGHALHAAVRKMGLHDTPNMYPYLEPRVRLLNDAANSLRLREWLSDLYVADSYVRRNVRYLYGKTGVLHAMCLGIVVAGSLLEDASINLAVPSRGAGACTDDVQSAAQAADDASRWLILSEMLRNGLADQGSTRAAMAKVADPETVLHDTAPSFAGSNVRMAVVGFTGKMVLRKMARNNFAFQPTAPEVATDNTVRGDSIVLQDRLSEKPANADARDWVSTILEQRGPVASTTTRRGNRAITAPAEYSGPASVNVLDVPDELCTAYEQIVERGWCEQDTSGERLECGANALHQSLAAHGAVTGAQVPTHDEVLTALRTSLSPEQRTRSEDAGIRIEDNNFTADQMAIALQRFGRYALGVIDGPPEQARTYTVGDGEPIFVRNYGNHWSGIGPGVRRIGYTPAPRHHHTAD